MDPATNGTNGGVTERGEVGVVIMTKEVAWPL